MSEEGSIVVVQAFDPVRLLAGKKRKALQKDAVVLISSRYKYVKFHNESASGCRLHGFVLHHPTFRHNRNFCKILSSQNIKEAVNELFDSHPMNPEAIHRFLDDYAFSDDSEHECKTETKKKGQLDDRLIKLNRYIRKNYTNPYLTLSSLRELFNLNPTYISNCYSRVFKKSPIYHLNLIRIHHAVKLLELNDLKINEIARRVGYSSAAQFSSMFRRYYNMTPSEYRSIAINK